MEGNGIQYGKITVTGAAGRRGKEQGMKENGVIQEYTGSLSRQIREEYHIGEEYYHGEIKRGLRNSDGTGVMVGVTKVGSVQGYLLQDGQRIPIPGRLYYRGIELNDIVEAHRAEGTFGFEEVAYLLLLLMGAAVVAWGQNDFAEAFTISLACLSNIGPAMGSIGPVGDFSSLTEVSKLMMILWMLLGRLELMPILVMLSPGTWKER